MNDDEAAREMGMVQYKPHKGKTGEIMRWTKRYLVAARETGELQFYKNDQALKPKGVVAVRNIVSLSAASKGPVLEVTMKGGALKGFSLKMQTQDIRDMWLANIRQMMEEGDGPGIPREKEHVRSIIEDWKAQVSGVLGYDVRLTVDELSFVGGHGPHCLAAMLEGHWVPGLLQVFRELASGRHVVHSVSRIVLRNISSPDDPKWNGRVSTFDKTTGALVLRFMWGGAAELSVADGRRRASGSFGNVGGRGQLRAPDASTILPLLITTAWQRGIDHALEKSASWREAVRRLQSAVGKDVPIALDWDPELHDDSDEVRAYIDAWATGAYLAAVTKAIQAAIPGAKGVSDLDAWLGGISLFIEADRLVANSPPNVRLHRMASRPEDDGGISRAMINLFYKCKGDSAAVYSGILCQGAAAELTQAVSETIAHMNMVSLIRQAEKITVGGAGQEDRVDFVVNWDSFLATTAALELPPGARLKLARALLSQYPGRVESVTKALSHQDWGILCSSLSGFSVLFVDGACSRRTCVEERDIVDVCVVDRTRKATGGESVVLHFDVRDLGSFCRGLLTGLSGVDPTGEPGSTFIPARPRAYRSAFNGADSEREDNADGYSGSSASDYGGYGGMLEVGRGADATLRGSFASMPTRNASIRARGMTHASESPPGKQAPTQYAEDSAPLHDTTLPQLLLRDLHGNDLDETYPLSVELLRDIVAALNQTFSDRGTIEPQDKLVIIRQAILKLRQTFHRHDPENKGVISADDLADVIDKFQEFQPIGRAKASASMGLAQRILQGQAVASWDVTAAVLMTRLFPIDVRQCMVHKKHCLLLGLTSTGKSTILNALKGKDCETNPTIGQREEIVGVEDLMISICEVGGSPDQVQNWSLHSKQAGSTHGIVFVVDAMKPSTFEHARMYLKDVMQSRHLRRAPLLLIVNNLPTKDPKKELEVVSTLKVEKYCKHGKRPYRILSGDFGNPLSGKATQEVHNALMWLVLHTSDTR